MSNPNISNLFWQHQLLESLASQQRRWLSERVRVEKFPARSTIFQPSDAAEGLYFLLEGKVKLEATSGKGDWVIKRICSNGDFFGTKGLLGRPFREEFARCLRDEVWAVLLPNRELARLMEVNFEFSEKVLALVGQELRYMEERTLDLTALSAKERFLKFVLSMTEKWGSQEGDAWHFNSQLTQEEIGMYIGTGRQTVTEILHELKSQGVMQYSWGRFFVQKIESLRVR